ncbi:MAG: hypothetical protein AB7I38_11095 [Dehalococcoidia bacterium]
MGAQWPFADRVERAWEHEGVWHAVVLVNLRPAGRAGLSGSGDCDFTVCGIPTGNEGLAVHHEVTCTDCLFGGLDVVLREFSEAPRELVKPWPVPA